MKIVVCIVAALVLSGCSQPVPGPAGPPGPIGPQGLPGIAGAPGESCDCSPVVRERIVKIDASDFQVAIPDHAYDAIAANEWPKNARITGLWIDPASIHDFYLAGTTIYMNVGTAAAPALYAWNVPISGYKPSVVGHEGNGLDPGFGGFITDPLQIIIHNGDNMPLIGSVGSLDLHVVVETPATF